MMIFIILKLCVPCILHVFTTYNQQMHNIFNIWLYLKELQHVSMMIEASKHVGDFLDTIMY